MNCINTSSQTRKKWATVLALGLAIIPGIALALGMWAHQVLVAEQTRWAAYAAAHHCKATDYSAPYRSYECDDGFTYSRMEVK